ncbi:MAG TPA: DUF5060 domain-containing protein, partial [Bacteroidia bacterium]|nr:DUF5060 domain-containing protein [Bacteroidia bacterium]
MKKKIALLISGMGLVSAGFGQYPFSGPTTTVNSDVNSSTTESQFNTSIVAPSPSTTTVTDHYSGTANVTYTGGQSIVLQPGFYASGFSSGLNGFFKAVIGGTQVAAQIMSGWPFYKYSRFEIGVQLPASVQAKIDTYLASISSGNPVISCSTSGLPTTYYNPYDPNQIEIDAVFTSPSSINYPRNGFYYQDVTANTTDGSYSLADDPWPFRIRFAPPEAGNWTVTITAKVNGATLSGSAFVGTFTVTDDANKGNIIVSGNQHYLSFQDDGSSYFPVGQDLNQADERFSKGIFCWGCGVPPDMYALHQQRVASLASNGGNFMRLFMSPQSYQFEFVGPTSAENVTPATHLYGSNDDCHLSPPPYNGVTNTNAYFTPPTTNLRMPGYYEQLQAYEMDNVFNISEANGVYMMLTILPDQYFDVGEAPSESWGTNNPYYNYLKSQYPSDASNPTKLAEDFFTDACAQQFFKDHLYYMQARWGYSPNIATWELINETEQTCLFTDAAYPGGTSLYMDKTEYPNAQTEISNWVTTMRNYITNSYVFYPVHLFTSGYGSGPCVDGSNGVDVSDYNYDLFDSHSYTWGQDNPITEFSCRLSYYASMSWANSVYNNPSSSHTSTNRPFIFGEMGHGCAGLDGCTNDGLHGSLWSGAFMSSGAASYFWGQDNDALRANFNALHIFFSSINFSTTTFDYNTTQHVNSIATGVNVEQFYLNDNYYGTVRQMGWLRNTTVNWQGEDYNCAAGDGHCWW